MLKFIPLFLLFTSLNAQELWVTEQIEREMKNISSSYCSSEDLRHWFISYSERGGSALFMEVKQGHPMFQATKSHDMRRAQAVKAYFRELGQTYRLPDMSLIILLSDTNSLFDSKVPACAFSKKQGRDNLFLIPDFQIYEEFSGTTSRHIEASKRLIPQNPWEAKKSVAHFRGAPTGKRIKGSAFAGSIRQKLICFSYKHPDLVDASFSNAGMIVNSNRIFLQNLGKTGCSASLPEQYGYKYIIDVDGNTSSYSRGRWITLSNSVLVKVLSEDYMWYYAGLEPWVHYVPIKNDLSNLEEAIVYLQENDDKAEEIAMEGRKRGLTIFSREFVDLYMIELLRAYVVQMHR